MDIMFISSLSLWYFHTIFVDGSHFNNDPSLNQFDALSCAEYSNHYCIFTLNDEKKQNFYYYENFHSAFKARLTHLDTD